jgi:8-oxo-dGTP pyrophosphatase MutT (NUDIX family)
MSTIPVNDSLPLLKQACAVPYRLGADGVWVCLVSSLSRRRWGFPKGLVEPGETPEQTAYKEAFEEAGVQGRIVGGPVGSYRSIKCETPLEVVGYLLLVTMELHAWPEQAVRQRRWAAAEEAMQLIGQRGQRELLAAAIQRLEQVVREG